MKEEILPFFKGDIMDSVDMLEKYSTDWSLFQVMPELVVFPRDTQDIQRLVQWVAENKEKNPQLSLTVRAAGTDMTGGPLNDSIIVDVTRYMNTADEVEAKNLGMQKSPTGREYIVSGKVHVQPGMMYRDFENVTDEQNMMMPCYPASKNICAVGGMVANNGAGEKTLKYGQNKDFVHELRAVLADGNEYFIKPLSYYQLQSKISQSGFEGKVYDNIWRLIQNHLESIKSARPKTAKNASGYLIWDVLQAPSIEAFKKGEGYFDLTKLFVGAQGTTGVITDITYKLVEKEKYSNMLVVFVKDLASLPELTATLLESDIETLEMYDDKTFKMGVKFFRDFVKNKGFGGAVRYALRFLPDLWRVIMGGVPKFIVLAEFVSNDPVSLKQEVEQAEKAIRRFKHKTIKALTPESQAKYWDFRHDSFKILTEHTLASRKSGEGTRTAPFIDDIAVDPKHFNEYIPRLIDILKEYDLLNTVAGHLGSGNLHIIPLIDMSRQENRDDIIEITERVYSLALEYGGTISAEHNDGIIRTPFLKDMFGDEMVEIFQEIKNIFDPQNIFNPGKKVGGTKQDIRQKMA